MLNNTNIVKIAEEITNKFTETEYLRRTKVPIPERIRKTLKSIGYGSIRLGIAHAYSHLTNDDIYPRLRGKLYIFLVPHKGGNSLRNYYTEVTSEEIDGMFFKPNEMETLVNKAKDIGNDKKYLTRILKDYLKNVKGIVNHHWLLSSCRHMPQ